MGNQKQPFWFWPLEGARRTLPPQQGVGLVALGTGPELLQLMAAYLCLCIKSVLSN